MITPEIDAYSFYLLTTVERYAQMTATLFWVCSFVTLYLRHASPQFQRLSRYGARSVTETSSSEEQKRSADKGLAETFIQLVHRSFLMSFRVSRKWCFISFYLVGTATCLLLVDGVRLLLPPENTSSSVAVACANRLFLIHCVQRLLECLFVHRFLPFAQDNVSLFAALAGDVFYVFAAISCIDAAPAEPLPRRGHGRATLLPSQLVSPALCVYACLCAVQVFVHWTLAGQRRSEKKSIRNERQSARQRFSALAAQVTNARQTHTDGSDERLWSYHYPSHCVCFRVVLEPHYLCEVLLYGFILLFFVCFTPRGGVWGQRALNTCLAGVFSLVNLGTTAAEHRRFWVQLNRRRAAMLQALPSKESSQFEKFLVPEELPRWNLIPLVW